MWHVRDGKNNRAILPYLSGTSSLHRGSGGKWIAYDTPAALRNGLPACHFHGRESHSCRMKKVSPLKTCRHVRKMICPPSIRCRIVENMPSSPTKLIAFRCSDELLQKLDLIAASMHTSRTSIVIEAVRVLLKEVKGRNGRLVPPYKGKSLLRSLEFEPDGRGRNRGPGVSP